MVRIVIADGYDGQYYVIARHKSAVAIPANADLKKRVANKGNNNVKNGAIRKKIKKA